MAFILKVHKTGDGRKLVCVTDEELLGKKFEEGSRQLDFTSSFYKGEQKPDDLIEKHIMSSYTTIFSGRDSVAYGLRLGVIGKQGILIVKGIPQAQCMIG